MPSFNRVMLMGHLTRDPALTYLPSGTAAVQFGVANNRRFRTASGEEREDVTFVDCAAFGKRGEVISQYLRKGSPIFVEGRLKYEQWEDRQHGGKRSKLSVVVEHFEFIGGASGISDGGGGGGDSGGDGSGGGSSNIRFSRRRGRKGGLSGDDYGMGAEGGDAPSPISDEPVFSEEDIPF